MWADDVVAELIESLPEAPDPVPILRMADCTVVAVEPSEDGFDAVLNTGERISATVQADSGVAPCPYKCKSKTHVHGIDLDDDEPISHRVAHCPGGGRSYFLLRPVTRGLLGTLVRWWESRESKESDQPNGLATLDGTFGGGGLLTDGGAR